MYSCNDDNNCTEYCSYCRLKDCLLSGMNISGVLKTGKERKLRPIEYTANQIEEILTTGSLFEPDDCKLQSEGTSGKVLTTERLTEPVLNDDKMSYQCPICLTRQGQHHHYGVKSCKSCSNFFFCSVQSAKVRILIFRFTFYQKIAFN